MPASAEPLLLDTSAAVALLVADHPAHQDVLAATGQRPLGLSGHAAFETYSVLTRLPGPLRRSPATVSRLIALNFPETRFLPVQAHSQLLRRAADLGLAGGSVYDALVGMTAVHHSLPLVSRDDRALRVYRRLGVELAEAAD
ncbi:MAG: type II toxin-antitoxin system VapC family toxin [Actinobacteria bacterium]|jgi:predicted nucleic acid-binding protein|nr:type II toxin-antitoxin system VapC family toxin [Actinomycetota bacterium]